jgi:hypothetical protein
MRTETPLDCRCRSRIHCGNSPQPTGPTFTNEWCICILCIFLPSFCHYFSSFLLLGTAITARATAATATVALSAAAPAAANAASAAAHGDLCCWPERLLQVPTIYAHAADVASGTSLPVTLPACCGHDHRYITSLDLFFTSMLPFCQHSGKFPIRSCAFHSTKNYLSGFLRPAMLLQKTSLPKESS